jgi:hypothetical protein
MRFLLVVFAFFALVVGLLVFQKYQRSRLTVPSPPSVVPASTRLVTLFFATPEGTGLAREGREIDACVDVAECVAATVGELLNGPLGDLEMVLPPATVIRGAKVEGDTATIDLSHDLLSGLPSGSSAEMVAVYAIVNTVAINFPQVSKVRLVVEGAPVETLKGHLDLRSPLEPDFSLERLSTPSGADGGGSAPPERKER